MEEDAKKTHLFSLGGPRSLPTCMHAGMHAGMQASSHFPGRPRTCTALFCLINTVFWREDQKETRHVKMEDESTLFVCWNVVVTPYKKRGRGGLFIRIDLTKTLIALLLWHFYNDICSSICASTRLQNQVGDWWYIVGPDVLKALTNIHFTTLTTDTDGRFLIGCQINGKLVLLSIFYWNAVWD